MFASLISLIECIRYICLLITVTVPALSWMKRSFGLLSRKIVASRNMIRQFLQISNGTLFADFDLVWK